MLQEISRLHTKGKMCVQNRKPRFRSIWYLLISNYNYYPRKYIAPNIIM